MRKLCMLFFLLPVVMARGQQDPIYAQYMNTPLLINAAYSGFSRDLTGSISYRKQWAGFDGNPVTMNAAGHIALADNKMGAGLVLLQDKIGSDETTEVQLTYGYHLQLKSDLKLSFGLQGGTVNYQTDYNDLTYDPNDPKLTPVSEWQPTIGTGVMLSSERFLVSVSVPKMLKPSDDADSTATGLYNRNFYVMGAYVFNPSTRIRLKPYLLLRSATHAPSSLDVGVQMTSDNAYTLGLFTRDLNALGFLAQIKVGDMVRFGYVFELPIGESVGTRFTSHEFSASVRLKALRFHDIESTRNF